MKELINIYEYPVKEMLPLLLQDMTTKQNIIFATDAYENLGPAFDERSQMTVKMFEGFLKNEIQPRVCKSLEQQADRTRKKAEVFTPSWICNKMNNHCDEEWFGRTGVFNTETEQDWIVNPEPVAFEKPKDWQKYVDSKRLEITCGEAPYIVSRYDAATGEITAIRLVITILYQKRFSHSI